MAIMQLTTAVLSAAALLLLAACGGSAGGPPTEASWRMQAERYCADGPYARNTPAFEYCVNQEMARHQRAIDSKRLYDSTIRNIQTSPPP
jgi:hypothetical protein